MMTDNSFRLFLPRVADTGAALAPAVTDFRVTCGQETILLVEDEEALRPNLRVLFMSGHSETASLPGGDITPGAAFVHKPFSPLALAREVRHLLDAP
jgi:hypothetical protein